MPRISELLRLLAEYTPTAAESTALAEMQLLTQHPDDVLSADVFDPGHFTASAFVTDSEVANIVLLHHGRVGAWLQPGGHIEPHDETVEAAARREVTEETGLTHLGAPGSGLFDIDVHRVPSHRERPSHNHFDLRFHFTTDDTDLEVPPGGDEVRWVSLDDVRTWTQDSSVLRSVDKLAELAGRR